MEISIKCGEGSTLFRVWCLRHLSPFQKQLNALVLVVSWAHAISTAYISPSRLNCEIINSNLTTS